MTDHLMRHPRIMILAVVLTTMAAAQAQQRKLGTIGPPPRQDPQRQTSAEGLPPLPLPAVPLRRSEPKAEPAPPLFIGKLKYGQTQDYMPNPGDVDSLLRHVRAQLDAWYGWQLYGLDELVAAHQAGNNSTLPMLYMTGYEAFALNDDERLALRQYVLDGGTIVADATLGSPAFAQSFASEMQQTFPQHPLKPLPLDHPVFRGYYPYTHVHYFTVAGGTHTKTQGPPEMLGVTIAARTAVIFSPYDMTCGWDEFYAPPPDAKVPDAPRTKAMLPGDAIRMGINIVSYVSAQRRFGRSQAETRQIIGDQPQKRAGVPLAVLRHQGDWNPDPNALYQLLRLAANHTSVPIEFELRTVDASLEQLADVTVLIIHGMDDPVLSDTDVSVLRRHLQAGGFIFINNTSGFATFDRAARTLITRITPDVALEKIPLDHPLLTNLYTIDVMRDAGTMKPRAPDVEAVTVNSRAVIVYCPTDTLAQLKGIHDPYANAYDRESASKLALNILTYAMKR